MKKSFNNLFIIILTVFCLLLSSCGETVTDSETESTTEMDDMSDITVNESAIIENSPITLIGNIAVTSDPRCADDKLIITCNVTDYGAVADGDYSGNGTDNTAAFKKALDYASKQGGGVVYVPAGCYRIDGALTVPRSVYLSGAWYDPDVSPERIADGSVIVTSYGKNNTTGAFITVGASAGILGLTVYYPEQNAVAPIQYAPTVLLQDNIAGDGTQHAASASCLTLVNSYYGIDASRGNQLHYINKARITAFELGFSVNKCYDCGRVMDMSISPVYASAFAAATGGDGKAVLTDTASAMRSNCTAIMLMRTDWQMMYDIFIESCEVGISCIRNPESNEETAGNGSFIELSVSDCTTAVDCAYGSFQFSRGNFSTSDTTVIMRESAVGSFSFYDCGLIGKLCAYIESGSRGMLSMQGCRFSGWKTEAVSAEGGSLELQSCSFDGNGNAVRVTDSARTAVCDGNTYSSSVTEPFTNALSGDYKVINADDDPLSVIDFAIDLGSASLPSSTSNIVSVSDFGADGKAVCGSNTNKDDTGAFEAAIAALGGSGGIVYVPAGYYNVAGSLTLPSGVELRGVHQSLHVTTGEGSVIFVTSGKGESDGTPFITLEKSSGVRGLTFWYPEQSYKAIVEYPWLIQGNGQDVWVRDVCVGNCWRAINLASSDCGGHYIENITGCILSEGIAVDGSSKAGHIINTHFNLTFYSAVWGTKLTDSSGSFGESDMAVTLMGHLNSELTAYSFGSTIDETALFIFNYRAATGMRFTGGFDGRLCGSGVDGSVVGIHITGKYEKPLKLLNFTDDIVPGSSKVGNTAIYVKADEGSEIAFASSSASSYNYIPPFLVRAVSGKLILQGFNANVSPTGNKTAAILVDGGDVVASGVTFKHVGPLKPDGSFSQQNERSKAYDVRIIKGSLSLRGATANYFFSYNTDKGESKELYYTVAE